MEPRSGSRITCCAGAEGSCEGLLFRSRGSLAFAAELVLDAEDRLRDFGGVRAVSSTVVRRGYSSEEPLDTCLVEFRGLLLDERLAILGDLRVLVGCLEDMLVRSWPWLRHEPLNY